MGQDVRKPVLGSLRTTNAQTSLRIRAVWSAPLSFARDFVIRPETKISAGIFIYVCTLCVQVVSGDTV